MNRLTHTQGVPSSGFFWQEVMKSLGQGAQREKSGLSFIQGIAQKVSVLSCIFTLNSFGGKAHLIMGHELQSGPHSACSFQGWVGGVGVIVYSDSRE